MSVGAGARLLQSIVRVGAQADFLALACKLVAQHPRFSRLSNDKAQAIAIIVLAIILEVFWFGGRRSGVEYTSNDYAAF